MNRGIRPLPIALFAMMLFGLAVFGCESARTPVNLQQADEVRSTSA